MEESRETTPKHGDLEVHWVPQVPMKPFRVPVRNLREAALLLDVLSEYDKFQYENGIKPDYCNMGILAMWDASDPDENGDCWVDWYDEETGDDFCTYCESHPELIGKGD